jgi:N-acetylmuramoyl-L-alanine amidase
MYEMLSVVKPINVMVLSLWLTAFTLCPVAVSAKDFVVAIDKGHSAEQPGAISARGVGEYFFNKRIAEGVHASLAAQPGGITSFLIDGQDGNLALADRARLASEKKADLLISIHHDSVQPEFLSFWNVQGAKHHYCDNFKGYSLYYSEKNAEPYDSILFAIFLSSEMLKNKFTPTLHHADYMKGEDKALVDAEKGIYKYNNLVVLKKAQMPAVLFECGIIVNREEELELQDKYCKQNIIDSITAAIRKYVRFKNRQQNIKTQ